MSPASPESPTRGRRVWRFVRRRVVALLVLYVGVVLVFLLIERYLVFRPSAAEDWLEPVDRHTRDVWCTAADGAAVHGLWLPPERPDAGAFLIAHGNGGNVSHRTLLAADLRRTLGTGVL